MLVNKLNAQKSELLPETNDINILKCGCSMHLIVNIAASCKKQLNEFEEFSGSCKLGAAGVSYFRPS